MSEKQKTLLTKNKGNSNKKTHTNKSDNKTCLAYKKTTSGCEIMDFRIKNNATIFLISLSFRIPFTLQVLRFSFHTYRHPDIMTCGISSRCQDGKHVFFADYDKADIKQIIDEIKYLQKYYKMGWFYIFKSGKENYHAICLDKNSLWQTHEILKNSNCDFGYANSVKMSRGREWILRTVAKGKRKAPKWISSIPSKYNSNVISTAHKEFLEKWYGVETHKYKKEDNIHELPIINYSTGNRV